MRAVAAGEIGAVGIAQTSRGSSDHYANAILQTTIVKLSESSVALRTIGFKEQGLAFGRKQPGIGFSKPSAA